MSFFSGKILFIFILLLAVVALSSYVYFSRSNTSTSSLPVQKMDSPSPSPYLTPRIAPLPSSSPSIPYDQLTQQQKEQAQTRADEYYQKTQDAVLENYPWYPKLPLKGTYYFVYFDPPTETFIAKLYPQKSSSISQDEQVASLKNSVISQIIALSSDTEKYKIDWRIIPE